MQIGFIKDSLFVLTDDITLEAVVQGKLKNENILPIIEHWIQFENQQTIQLVIATPLCLMNLQEWLDSKTFEFENIRNYLLQICEALQYLSNQNVIHRDVKLLNILVKSKNHVLLGDFGLVKKDGVTPIYCAPEQLTRSVVGATDTHGFGITILFSFFEHASAIQILFAAAKDGDQTSIMLVRQDPIVQLVKNMISFEPDDRISLETAKNVLTGLEHFPSRKNIYKQKHAQPQFKYGFSKFS